MEKILELPRNPPRCEREEDKKRVLTFVQYVTTLSHFSSLARQTVFMVAGQQKIKKDEFWPTNLRCDYKTSSKRMNKYKDITMHQYNPIVISTTTIISKTVPARLLQQGIEILIISLCSNAVKGATSKPKAAAYLALSSPCTCNRDCFKKDYID